jgi:hypothetical protein
MLGDYLGWFHVILVFAKRELRQLRNSIVGITVNPVKFETINFKISAIRLAITAFISVGKRKTIHVDSYMIIPRKYIYQIIYWNTELYTNSVTVSYSYDEEMYVNKH